MDGLMEEDSEALGGGAWKFCLENFKDRVKCFCKCFENVKIKSRDFILITQLIDGKAHCVLLLRFNSGFWWIDDNHLPEQYVWEITFCGFKEVKAAQVFCMPLKLLNTYKSLSFGDAYWSMEWYDAWDFSQWGAVSRGGGKDESRLDVVGIIVEAG